MPVKTPEKLLSVQELAAYTGFHRTTVTKMMNDPKVWAVPGGAKLINGEFRLSVTFYNKWVEAQDIALA